MKSYFFLMVISFSSIASCKSQQAVNAYGTANEQNSEAPITIGKVSHQYKATGCETVVVVRLESDELLTLIPKDKLNEFDVDGLEIKFNYRTLKMPTPAGCKVGIPAELKNISKK
jgi:hypothetical protein